MKQGSFLASLILIGSIIHYACSAHNPADVSMPDDRLPEALTAEGPLQPDKLIAALAKKRVVFIGERHDRYDHHLNQLAIIRRLYEIHPRMAIGLEMFQQPFQPYLDAYIAGTLDEREFLKKTEYYQRWGFDDRLYRPILRFAREKGIALLALNVPQEIVHKVAVSGLESLNEQERVWVPPVIDKSDTAYRDRLKAIFKQHSQGNAENFEYFVEAQLLWDEAMAARAARYLREHPRYNLVVLAGNGHLAYGSGIPNRLRRRVPVAMSIVLQGDRDTKDRQGADYRLLSQKRDLPPPP